MPFKDISYVKLWRPICLAEWDHFYYFCKGHFEKLFCKIILKLDQWFRRFSCLQLCQPIYLTEGDHLYNFCEGHFGKQFCKIILNFDQWFRRYFLSTALAAHTFDGRGPFVQLW